MERTLDFFHPPRSIKNRKVVIGIDPGVTTGLSVMIVSDLKHGVEGVMAWGSDQISYGGSGNVRDLYQGDKSFPKLKEEIDDINSTDSPYVVWVDGTANNGFGPAIQAENLFSIEMEE